MSISFNMLMRKKIFIVTAGAQLYYCAKACDSMYYRLILNDTEAWHDE